MIKAILFDFDGIVIDSEPLHAKAKKIVLEKFKISYPTTIFDDYKGRTDKGCFVYALTSSFSSNALMEADADEIIKSYDELTIKLNY